MLLITCRNKSYCKFIKLIKCNLYHFFLILWEFKSSFIELNKISFNFLLILVQEVFFKFLHRSLFYNFFCLLTTFPLVLISWKFAISSSTSLGSTLTPVYYGKAYWVGKIINTFVGENSKIFLVSIFFVCNNNQPLLLII